MNTHMDTQQRILEPSWEDTGPADHGTGEASKWFNPTVTLDLNQDKPMIDLSHSTLQMPMVIDWDLQQEVEDARMSLWQWVTAGALGLGLAAAIGGALFLAVDLRNGNPAQPQNEMPPPQTVTFEEQDARSITTVIAGVSQGGIAGHDGNTVLPTRPPPPAQEPAQTTTNPVRPTEGTVAVTPDTEPQEPTITQRSTTTADATTIPVTTQTTVQSTTTTTEQGTSSPTTTEAPTTTGPPTSVETTQQITTSSTTPTTETPTTPRPTTTDVECSINCVP